MVLPGRTSIKMACVLPRHAYDSENRATIDVCGYKKCLHERKPNMNWFEQLTGFPETSADDLRAKLELKGGRINSLVNGRTMVAGQFTTPQLSHLRQRFQIPDQSSPTTIREVVADVQSLHQAPANANAVFQVASQFNCLEMISPHAVPEDGIGIYQNDRTQGPACCIAAGAGTIFRNYLVDIKGQIGQTADRQLDCLSAVGQHFQNEQNQLWKMQNGYCFPSRQGLEAIENQLAAASPNEIDVIQGKLMVGVQSNTEVTLGDSNHQVTQVFCSALPVAYSNIPAGRWNLFPKLVLDASYELTFYTALQNQIENNNAKLFLTLVGGGVFGNKLDWILSAIDRSLKLFSRTGFEVAIVSYGASNPRVADFVHRHNAT
jgi:hypothetical protein